MLEPKPLPVEAVLSALEKAEHYRLLGEPFAAESICRDVLGVEPANHRALVTLLLALSDQLGDGPAEKYRQASEIIVRLNDAYERAYYAGILCERRAKAVLRANGPQAGCMAYEWLREAMGHYERAAAAQPHERHGDPILRWNACVRILNQRPDLRPAPEEPAQDMLE